MRENNCPNIRIKNIFRYLDVRNTSFFVFPIVLSLIISFEIIRAVIITHPRFGTRISIITVLISFIWIFLFVKNQKEVNNTEKKGYITFPILSTVVLALFLGIFMVCASWGKGYLSLVPYEALDNGTQQADSLFLSSIHVADARTCVLHPASHTHRQLSDEK